ncbi:hypothetical protein E2320_014082, partial [Naja naja]
PYEGKGADRGVDSLQACMVRGGLPF